MEKLFSDVFYNRHCFGSLYHVDQQDEKKRQPTIDFNQSVDRIHMVNRNQTEFIGTDIASKFHFEFDVKKRKRSYSQSIDETDDIYDNYTSVPNDRAEVEESMKLSLRYADDIALFDKTYESRAKVAKGDDRTSYLKELTKQTSQTYGSSAVRMIVSNDESVGEFCFCFESANYNTKTLGDRIRTYNHLIFDFDTHRMTVEERSGKELSQAKYSSLLSQTMAEIQESMETDVFKVSYYRVNIEEVTTKSQGFNHASCNCSAPDITTDQFSFLDYNYLTHVDLAVIHHENYVSVLAVYGGVAAL